MPTTAIHRTTWEYYAGVPDTLPTGTWIINPDISAVSGVAQIYWKVSGDSVVEMSADEKYLRDLQLAAQASASGSPEQVIVTNQLTIDNKTTSDGRLKVALEKSDDKFENIVTHDFTNKCTWYQDSALASGVALSGINGSLTEFKTPHHCLIDTYHGKLFNEDVLIDKIGMDYRIHVYISGVELTEQDPHYGTGGDYVVDYVSGIVTMMSPVESGVTPTATYHYAQSSRFIIEPPTGKKYSLEFAEVQFSSDIEMNDTVRYETYGYAAVFAPQLGLPLGTRIPIRTTVFKTIRDFQSDALRAYPTYPPLGTNWRGISKPCTVFDWDYQRSIPIHEPLGMQLHIVLEHDTEFDGTYANATMYFAEDDSEHAT